jgi:rhodanese-related sulfurtransferase
LARVLPLMLLGAVEGHWEDSVPSPIGNDEVQRLIKAGAQLVDVMPTKEYDESHLPGAIHLPLTCLDRESAAQLHRDRPVVVYCFDTQ